MKQEKSPTNDKATNRGVIEAVLPRAMYSVRLDDGRVVRVGLSAAGRHQTVRLIAGDLVFVRLSPFDPHRGQILKKL